MRYKIMILTIILVCLLTISTVSAVENVTNDVVSVEETIDETVSVDETTNNIVSVETDNQIIGDGNKTDVGNFDDLSRDINAIEEKGILNLTRDYKYVNGSTDGVNISKAITIDGQGHIIDGNNLSGIFIISSDNVILKNLIFINSNSENSAIYYYDNPKNCILRNCSFENNVVAGAISAGGCYHNIIENCTFRNNSGLSGPGAIWGYGSDNRIINSLFINCHADGEYSMGGAIYVEGYIVENSKFINCYSKSGGAVGSVINCLCDNCSFINCSAQLYGGAIDFDMLRNFTVINCDFNNCYSNYGGAISGGRIEFIANCSFINCSAREGGAFYFVAENMVNCTYINCSAKKGGAIYVMDTVIVDNCNFINNTADYGSSIYGLGSKGIVNNSYFSPDSNNLYFVDDVSYYDYDGTCHMEIVKKNLNVFLNDSFYYKNAAFLDFSLKDDNEVMLINNLINLNIFNENNSTNFKIYLNDDGIKTFKDYLSRLNVGTWNVTVAFEGNDNYVPCNTITTINVIPPNSSVNIDDFNTTIGHEVNLVANVNSNFTINEGTIVFFDGETQIGESPVYDGVATLTYAPTEGEHAITAIFNSTNYLSSNKTAKLLVDSASINILVNQGIVGYNSTFVAVVKGLYSTVNEGVVYFNVNDEYLGSVPVVDGFASINYMPLNANNYTVKAVFGDSNKFLNDESSISYTVVPADSVVAIDDMDSTVGHDIVITVNITSSNNQTINEGTVVLFDGSAQIGESPVSDGVATLTYTPTTAAEHEITAMYYGTNYEDNINSALLNVSKADVVLNIDNIQTVFFTNPSNFAVNVLSNSKGVNEGNVKYYVNGNYIGMSYIYDGETSISFITNTTGSFDLLVVFNETDNYFAHNASTTFYVNQMPTTLTGESIIFDEQAYKTFKTELKDDNNYGVNGQTVRIEVIKYSGESATFTGVSDINGITLYDVGNLAGGMWYVAGNYDGNENYIESNFADKFIVVRMNTTTSIEEISNAQVNHSYKLKANIHDENGKLVKEGIVQFYLDGVDIGSIDLSKNQGHQSALSESVLGAVNQMFEYILGADDTSDLYINYVPTKAGEHTLTAVYEGTTIYKSSNSTTTFTVSDVNVEPEIVIPLLDNISNNETIEVKLPDDANGTVTLTVNGKDYVFDVVSGKSDVKLPELDNGNYNYTITYSGDDKYSSFSKSASLTINKIIPTTISASKVSTAYNGGKYITAILKDSNGNPLNGVNVTVKFSNGKTATAKTDKNGQVKISTDKLAPVKKYTATIIFAGNSKYAKSTKTVNVYVVKANLKVTPTLKKYKANVKYKKYYVTVKNSKNQKLKNIKVSIIVKGKTFSAYTLKNGVATLKVTNLLKKGTYKAYVSFAGSKYYNKISKKVYIKVK